MGRERRGYCGPLNTIDRNDFSISMWGGHAAWRQDSPPSDTAHLYEVTCRGGSDIAVPSSVARRSCLPGAVPAESFFWPAGAAACEWSRPTRIGLDGRASLVAEMTVDAPAFSDVLGECVRHPQRQHPHAVRTCFHGFLPLTREMCRRSVRTPASCLRCGRAPRPGRPPLASPRRLSVAAEHGQSRGFIACDRPHGLHIAEPVTRC